MRRFPASVLLALLLACLAAGAAKGGAAARPDALWTPAELAEPADPAAAQAERRIVRLPRPDPTPPARTTPRETPPPLPAALRGIIRRVNLPPGDRRVALTFDLCERSVNVTGYDARLVDVLRRAGAHATFFACGRWLRSHPERGRQLMADRHFEIGSHSWSHANMFVAGGAMRLRQVLWTEGEYELLAEGLDRRLAARGLPQRRLPALRLFRPPYGRCDAGTARWLNDRGLAVILWDVPGGCFGGTTRERARRIAAAVRPGSIILLHANAVPRNTAALVRELLPLLRRKGYATATVGELLRAGRPETVPEGFFRTPGDNRIYDTMFLDAGTGFRAARKRR